MHQLLLSIRHLNHAMNTAAATVLLCSLITTGVTMTAAGEIDLPNPYPRTNPNLLANPTFDGSTSWSYAGKNGTTPMHVADPTGGHTPDGTGYIKFPGNTAQEYAQIKSEMFYMTGHGGALQYDAPYTISWHMKTQNEPVYVSACLHMYDADGNRTFSHGTGQGAVSTTGEWQEVVCVVRVTDPNVVRVQVVVEAPPVITYPQDFYVDDVYFGYGVSLTENPAASRQTFTSGNVTIDELGNWRVFENGQWKDFFPFGLQVNNLRTNYQSLSDQGFNLLLAVQWRYQVERAQNAVNAVYNPTGLRIGLRLARYAVPGDSYWTHARLASVIQDLNGNSGNPDLGETLLCYYWDNENNWSSWNYWFDMIDTVRNNDLDHPIFVLNGYPSVQRIFSKRLSDVCATYTGYASGNMMENGTDRIDLLQYAQKQDTPVSIAQINEVEETIYGMRMRVYYALIHGAKGVTWWGDGFAPGVDMDVTKLAENRAWWSDIPNLRNEIDQMMPLIRQKHWTAWSAACSDPDVFYNTRNLNNQGYMILMNPNGSPTNATFTLDGYAAREVRDYFTGDLVAVVDDGEFTVSLPAHATAVYQLYSNLLDNGGLDDVGSPMDGWIAAGDGTMTRDTTVKYAGEASGKIVNTLTNQNSTFLQFYEPLKSGTQYHFTARIKTENIVKQTPGDGVGGAVIQLYAGGVNLFFPTGLSGTNDWQQVEKTFTTPLAPNSTWYVRLRLWNASGTAWFDDVHFEEVQP